MTIYRSKFAMTAQMLEGMFQFPEGVEIERIEFDPERRIAVVILASAEPNEGVTYQVPESGELPFFDYGKYIENHESYKRLAELPEFGARIVEQ